MKEKTLTFRKPKNIIRPDSVVYEFPFSSVDSVLIGSAEEHQATTTHRLIVECSRTRLKAWKLSMVDQQKVLFEIGKRELLQRAATGALQETETVIVNSRTHGSTCPYDPSRLSEPNGVRLPLTGRRIGFR